MDTIRKAGEFIQAHGRDIDQARFAYHFGELSQAELLAVLARYQNSDGGFFGLEVDIAAPHSNPFAVELALLVCVQAGVARDHPLLQNVLTYLATTQDEAGGWRFTPEIYQHPLAPWFQAWKWPNLNPACTLAGLLIELGYAPLALLERVEALFNRLSRLEEVATGDFYEVRPYACYFLPDWDSPEAEFFRSGLLWWLIRQHALNKLDGTHFFDYIRSPRSFAGRCLPRNILNQRLHSLLAEQTEDGGWPTPYSENWRSWNTVNNLLVLRSFNWI